MTGRSSFSDAEWTLLNQTVLEVGFVATVLDMGGVSALREFRALLEELRRARATHAGLELIEALVDEAGQARSDEITAAPAGGFVDELLTRLPEAVRLVDARATPAEAQAYRQLLREVARATTEAAGSGLFGTGEKVSSAERAFLQRFDAALDAASAHVPRTEVAGPSMPSTLLASGRTAAPTLVTPGHAPAPSEVLPETRVATDEPASTVTIVGNPLTTRSS